MIKAITGIVSIVIILTIIYILYPDTGNYGIYFFYGSIAIWSFLYLYLTLNSSFFNLFPLSVILKALFFIFMILITTIITPQEDKRTILSKIINREFPDNQTIERGKIKYLKGVFIDTKRLNITIIDETENFIKKIKE